MKNIIKITESELINLIKQILREDSSTTNCVKEYKSPYPSDPYKYRIGAECLWETITDTSKPQKGHKQIPNWISLYENEKANVKLDKWFPKAKSDCNKCKTGGVVKKTLPETKCPDTINCMPTANKPNPCNDFFISYCISLGKTKRLS